MNNILKSRCTSIRTTYYGATNTKPSRIKTGAGMKRVLWISFPHDERDPHDAAAQALCEKFEWTGDLIKGETETGAVYVFAPKAPSHA